MESSNFNREIVTKQIEVPERQGDNEAKEACREAR